MSYSYETRKRGKTKTPEHELVREAPSIDALRSGAVKPTQEQMGRPVDLPESMREKMENAFGADLSAVKLYESQAVEDAGANAVAQGSNIAFAPGMLDLSSFGGQALLGHEISHVVSQARGEVTGSGFLNDHSLEARADREGAMAAAGQQISAPAAALSPVSAASASGPMQAGKKERREGNKKLDRLYSIHAYNKLGKQSPLNVMPHTHTPEQEQDLLASLTDYELDMLHQRQIDSAKKAYKFDQNLRADTNMGTGERMYRTMTSYDNVDSEIYRELLSSFAAGPRYYREMDDDDSGREKRAQASRDRVMKGVSAKDLRNIQELEATYDRGTDTRAEMDAFRTSTDKETKKLRKWLDRSRIDYMRNRVARLK